MEDGPWSCLLVIFTYLVLVKFLGPRIMKSRKPFNLRTLMFLHDVVLVLFNGWLFREGLIHLNYGLEAWNCSTINPNSTNLSDLYQIGLSWLFLISKFYQLQDTFFFVLRKKTSQVTVLHVLHHSSAPLMAWIVLKFSPGGNSSFFPLINSGIHTLMYTYYGLSTIPRFRRYLWWKRYLTQIQMIQYALVLLHGLNSSLNPDCQWPKIFIYLNSFNAILFLLLFYSFSRKAYRKSKPNLNGDMMTIIVSNSHTIQFFSNDYGENGIDPCGDTKSKYE